MAGRHEEEDLPWWSSPALEKEGWGRDLTDMDSQNKWCDGIEEIETNLRVAAEFTGTRRTDRKSSLESSPET
jgi:hypothetical protein